MVKLSILKTTPEEDIKSVQNRRVEEVTEYNEKNATGQRYKAWLGSTETEYFSIVFMFGIITITIDEREIHLGEKLIPYAVTENVIDFMSRVKNSELEIDKSVINYNQNIYPKELDEITFNHVMKIFKWRFKTKDVKLKDGIDFSC